MTSIKTHSENHADRPLHGKKIALTGKFNAVTHRQARANAREMGATVMHGVSGKTDYVVAGAKAGSKLQEAASRSVKIVNEDEFFDLVRQQRAAVKAAKLAAPKQ